MLLSRKKSMRPVRKLGWIVTILSLPLIHHAVTCRGQEAESRERTDFFESKIRPVLVRECYGCHSQAAEANGKLRGGLRLDSREGVLTGGETGPAVVPGQLSASLLINALKHQDWEMPPKGKLPDEVIADFEKWVLSGAVDPRVGEATKPAMAKPLDIESQRNFWSFRPLQIATPPDTIDSTRWARSSIDQFILAALQDKQLHPNVWATPRQLVRRAYLDLWGLPPSAEVMQSWIKRLEQVDAPENAASVNVKAWSELIDHLLENPHYGERQARHWMDVARFAESHGYEQDYDRPHAYHYRDFLIRAFNADLPYDQFVQWQLAGDELAPDEPLAWMATGFLGAGAFPTQLTEAEFESARYDELDDMVATTGVAFLGLSVGCARCHDHKFDPIPSADYYRMAANFTRAIRSEKSFDLQVEENAQRKREFAERVHRAQQRLDKYESARLPTAMVAWLADGAILPDKLATWQVLEWEVKSSAKTKFLKLDDGSYLAEGAPPAKEVLTLSTVVSGRKIQALRLEALCDDSLPRRGPGRADNGNFALGDVRLTIIDGQGDSQGQSSSAIRWQAARATHQQNADSLSVAASIDEDAITGWAVDGQIGKDQAAVFQLAEPLDTTAPVKLELRLTFNHPNGKHSIGRWRVSISSDPLAEPSVGNFGLTPESVEAVELLRAALESRDVPKNDVELQRFAAEHASAWSRLLPAYKKLDVGWQQRSVALKQLLSTGDGQVLSTVMVTSEGLPHMKHHADDRGFPHFYPEVHQLRRGDVAQKVSVAQPGVLQILSPSTIPQTDASAETQAAGRSRSAVARWLTDTQKGAGHLVARVMVNRIWQHHFGQGLVATPNDFGVSGQRPTHPELLDFLAHDLIDGEWRIKRLHKAIMTSSVYMQSTNVLPEDPRAKVDPDNQLHWRRTPRRLEAEAIRDSLLCASGLLDKSMYGPGTLDNSMRRRSIYFFIKRSQLIPSMMLFDWPEHLVSIGQRSMTTTAPQSLMFMNSSEGRVCAEALARRLDASDRQAAVERAYWELFGRDAAPAECELAGEFLARQTAIREATDGDKAALMAMADLCQTLFSMNEFIYID